MKKTILKRIYYFLIFGVLFFILSLVQPISVIAYDTDLENYHIFWEIISDIDLIDVPFNFEPGFVIFAKILSYIINFSGFIWIVKFIIFYSFFLFALKLNRNIFTVIFLSLILFFLYPPLQSLSNTVIRQGLATSILLIYFSFNDLEKIKLRNILFLSFFLLAFHYSSVFVLIALVIFLYVKGLHPFFIWSILNFLYIFNLPGELGFFIYQRTGLDIRSLSDAARFIDVGSDYSIGFKPLFLFANLIPVIVVFGLSFAGLLKINKREILGLSLFRFYFILNSLCVFTSLMPYHDRFFNWSWIFGSLLFMISLNFSKLRLGDESAKSFARIS